MNTSETPNDLKNANISKNPRVWKSLAYVSRFLLDLEDYLTLVEIELAFEGLLPVMTKLLQDYYVPDLNSDVRSAVLDFGSNLSSFYGSSGKLVSCLKTTARRRMGWRKSEKSPK